jgi:hypothetical protein
LLVQEWVMELMEEKGLMGGIYRAGIRWEEEVEG